MIEAVGTLRLLDALSTPRPIDELVELLKEPQLARMFPSLGIPTELGVRTLESVSREAEPAPGNELEKALYDYFSELRSARPRVEGWVVELAAQEEDLAAAAFGRTRAWLPTGSEAGPTRFVVLPLGFDFRTDRTTVYLDPLAGLQYGKDGLTATLAHELHHVARYRLTGENPTLMRPPEEPVLRTLGGVFREWARWLELEGIADLVSNVTQTEAPALRQAAAQRQAEMDRYEAMLGGALEKFWGKHLSRPQPRDDLSELRHGLRSLAHPVGARIAERILERSGRTTLVECVGAPRRFLERFNQLVPRDGGLEFPPKLLRCLPPGRRRQTRVPKAK